MASTTVAAREPIVAEEPATTPPSEPFWRRSWLSVGLRTRQIALITLLVAGIVSITTAVNIAHLTDVVVSRTEQELEQLSKQIEYGVRQELVFDNGSEGVNYARLATEHSGVRSLMESTIVTSKTISYVYLADSNDNVITDPDGGFELSANGYLIKNVRGPRPDFTSFTERSGYSKLLRILFGAPFYEFRNRLTSGGLSSGEPGLVADSSAAAQGLELHVGVSTAGLLRELNAPILTNLIIGLVSVIFAAIVAISLANLLLRPLEAISTSIDHLSLGTKPVPMGEVRLPRDEMVTGVATRLRQLGERLAGERSELEIMRGRLRQVISHLEERLLLVNREGRVILASPDAEQVLGVDSVDWTALPLSETLGRSHPLFDLVDRAFSERRSFARTSIHVPTQGGLRQVLVSVQYIEDSGEPVGALISIRDYESFQRFESQWDLSKKLADLGRITSGIAHEVKNPLNAMVIHLEILRSKLESGGNPTAQIDILDSEIKRLDRVVQTFLNFTRPVEIDLAPVDVNTIVSEVVALASTEASDRGIVINPHLSAEPLVVKADGDLLKQALLNVIINGCQAMPEGGPLKIVTAKGSDGSARISITDRGVGIPEEARERIFNLYYTTKKGGSGIGLAQAFRAIQLHNGSISFGSSVGVGTTFEITLPAAA
jgi:signal transduction histidine kinase